MRYVFKPVRHSMIAIAVLAVLALLFVFFFPKRLQSNVDRDTGTRGSAGFVATMLEDKHSGCTEYLISSQAVTAALGFLN